MFTLFLPGKLLFEQNFFLNLCLTYLLYILNELTYSIKPFYEKKLR